MILACLVAACTLFVSITLASGVHEHGQSHCCSYCHFGQIPCVAAADVPKVLPPMERQAGRIIEQAARTIDRVAITALGRAPPIC